MQDHDPLWYDYAEPEQEPGFILTSFAYFFSGALKMCAFPPRAYRWMRGIEEPVTEKMR